MGKGFYAVMGAQFFSSLADNALLVLCIYYLVILATPDWMPPLLKLVFVLSYVLLAPFVGAFADAYPKGRVMLYTNLLKILGCMLLFTSIHPLFAYAIVGFGAAAYSPAKYGILTELVPAEKLVIANGWIEGLTVGSIIFGVIIGSALVSDTFIGLFASERLLSFMPNGLLWGNCFLIGLYALAALINVYIPDSGARYGPQFAAPHLLLRDFWHCNCVLWRDKLGQITLSATTVAWGVGAVLQFILLKWASDHLGFNVSQGSLLLGVFAIGLTIGAVIAARRVALVDAWRVLQLRFLISGLILLMAFVYHEWLGYAILILAGISTGYFIVPMNALLQHRGYTLLSAGHSIAVQNFNENLAILVCLGLYALMLKLDWQIALVICIFALAIAAVLQIIITRHRFNMKVHQSLDLITQHHGQR